MGYGRRRQRRVASPVRRIADLVPAWAYARTDLKRRWKSTIAVAVLIGVAGAVVLTAYAGARRTDSAYPRYLRATQAADFLVATEASGPSITNHFYKQVDGPPASATQRGGPGTVACSRVT